jgi:hypothetical protein
MIDLHAVSRAALVALLLGTSGLGGAPAVHAQGLGFSFGFGIGNHDDDRFFFPRRLCLTDRGIREAIRDEGYRNIYLNVPIGRTVQARATRGDWVYLLRVDICTGDIVERKRLRRS